MDNDIKSKTQIDGQDIVANFKRTKIVRTTNDDITSHAREFNFYSIIFIIRLEQRLIRVLNQHHTANKINLKKRLDSGDGEEKQMHSLQTSRARCKTRDFGANPTDVYNKNTNTRHARYLNHLFVYTFHNTR